MPQLLAWNSGTTGSMTSLAEVPSASLALAMRGVNDVGAVRIQHALRIARGARGVAHRGRGIFVEILPLELAVGLRDPVLIGDRVLQRGLRHVRLVGQHDVALDARQLVGDLLQHRHEGDVGHHHAVFGVVDDPGDLLREQPRIDGMADRADAHDAVPAFEMAPGVPGDGGDAVAELDAVALAGSARPSARAHEFRRNWCDESGLRPSA